MSKLLIEKGAEKGKTFPIPVTGNMTVGRDTTCEVVLADTMISRFHFKLEISQKGLFLHDLESLNGTFVNGQQVKEVKLNIGDIIKVGLTTISLSSDEYVTDKLIGQTLSGKYEILEKIGIGGMGTCYKARQVDLDRIVAVKVISEEHSKKKDFVELFSREARFAAKINHTNVVQIHEVSNDGDYYYYAMEYVPGGSVQDLLILQKDHRLKPYQVIEIGLQVARALEYAHSKGILHRDIKPDNMLIAEGGSIKLTDLGLAQALGEKIRVGEGGYVLGTPHFIAPEILRNQPYDFRSDIYSLGVSLYIMLCGRSHYKASSLKELVNKKLNEDPIPLEQQLPEADRILAVTINKMISRDVNARYKDASELIGDLEKLKNKFSVKPTAIDKRLIAVGTVVVAILVILVIVLSLGQGEDKLKNPASLPVVDEGALALQMFENAKGFELTRMDSNSEASLKEAINNYSQIRDRFPNSKLSQDVLIRIDQLEKLLKNLRITGKLKDIEKIEEDYYNRFAQLITKSGFNLEPIDYLIGQYEKFAMDVRGDSEEIWNTAMGRASCIQSWKKIIIDIKTKYDVLVLSKTSISLGEQLKNMNELIGYIEQKKKEIQNTYHQRYNKVFFDEIAAKKKEQLIQLIHKSFDEFDKQVDSMIFENRFDEALKTVTQSVGAFVIPELEQKLSKKKDVILVKLDEYIKETQRHQQELHKKMLERDSELYELCEKKAQELTVTYRFSGALEEFTRKQSEFNTDEFKSKIQERIAHLQIITRLIQGYINMFNDQTGVYKIRRLFLGPAPANVKGEITQMQEEFLVIKREDVGQINFPLDRLNPLQYHSFLRGSISVNSIDDIAGFAALSIELGLYDKIAAELENLSKHSRFDGSSEYSRLYTSYKDHSEMKKFTGSDEVEASKWLKFIQAQFSEGAYLQVAQLMKTYINRFNSTKFFASKKDQITTFSNQLEKKILNAQFNELYKLEFDEAKRLNYDTISRINKLSDEMERYYLIGLVYHAVGSYGRSNQELQKARNRCRDILRKTENTGQIYRQFLRIQVTIMINCILQKDQNLFSQTKNELERIAREDFPERSALRKLYDKTVADVTNWAEDEYPKTSDKIKELEKQRDQLGQDGYWELALIYDKCRKIPEARACFKAVMELCKESAYVTSGECLYNYIETLFVSLDVKKTLSELKKLASNYPEFVPKTTFYQWHESTSIDESISLCEDLMKELKIKD